MFSVFIDTEYKDKGGSIFLIGALSSNHVFKSFYGYTLRWNCLNTFLRNKKRIFVYGPDIGKLETHFQVNIRSKWECINVLSMARTYLHHLPSKSLYNVELFFKIKRKSSDFKINTRTIFSEWCKSSSRPAIIEYNKDDVYNLMLVYHHLLLYIKQNKLPFNLSDFIIK